MIVAVSGRTLIVHCALPATAQLERPAAGPIPLYGDAHLWFATLNALHDRLGRYADLLDEGERARVARFRFEPDRERYILGHGLLRELLGHYLAIAPGAVVMPRGRFGKPYVEGHPLHFNLSDTKDAVLIAFSREQEIGADVETMTRTVDHEAVSEHYFTPEEIGDIARTADGKRRFLELWTRKEAVLKASGVGIMDDLRVLRVDAEHNTSAIAHEEFLRMAAPEYHLRTWHLGADHVVSLAAAVPMVPIRWLSAIG